MKSKSLIFILLAIFFSSVIKSQEIIPFKMNGHYNILVESIINKKDTVDLMFQIAMREASLSPNRTHKVESVVFDTTNFSDGLSKENSIRVGEIIVEPIWIWDNEHTGHGAEGKIGVQLFGDKIVKINYDQSQFELYSFLPDTTEFIRLPLEQKNGQLFIDVVSKVGNQKIPTKVLLQSGFSGAILYNNQLADNYQLANILQRLDEKKMTNSAGQQLINLVCTMPVIEIDSIHFNDVPVNLFAGEIKNQTTNYFGADFIHRFNWIIDIKGKTAYIQKNKYFTDSYYFANK